MPLTRRRLLACGIVVVGCAGVARSAPPTNATHAFVQEHSGASAMADAEGNLVALYGVPLFAYDGDPSGREGAVRQFVLDNGAAFGVDGLVLFVEPDPSEIVPEITIRNGELIVYTYRQAVPGTGELVDYAYIKVLMLLRSGTIAEDRVGYVGLRLPAPATDPLPPDLLTAEYALTEVLLRVSHFFPAGFLR